MSTSRSTSLLKRLLAVMVLPARVCLAVAPFSVRAGGLWMFEDAGPTVDKTWAGRAAVVSDESSAWGNRAGMTHLMVSNFLVGAEQHRRCQLLPSF